MMDDRRINNSLLFIYNIKMIPFIIVKLLGISFVVSLYFSLGFLTANVLDYFSGEFDVQLENVKSTWIIVAEVVLRVCLLGILIYAARNLVERIPFPLDGISGFKYGRLKELQSEFIFAIPLIEFHSHFFSKLDNLSKRLSIDGGGKSKE